MRAGDTLLTVLATAGTPSLALIVLAASGAANLLGTVIAISLTLLVALALALLWTRDLDVLSETVRRLDEGQPISENPALPGLERVGREIERLSRRLAERAALMERLRRADEAIVERLPDPLIVLAADRSVRRANNAAQVAFGADMAAVLRHPGLRGAIDRALINGGGRLRDGADCGDHLASACITGVASHCSADGPTADRWRTCRCGAVGSLARTCGGADAR